MSNLSNEVFAAFAFTFPTLGVLCAEVSSVWATVYGIFSFTASPTSYPKKLEFEQEHFMNNFFK